LHEKVRKTYHTNGAEISEKYEGKRRDCEKKPWGAQKILTPDVCFIGSKSRKRKTDEGRSDFGF